jgi:hypothetical protein
VLGHDRPQGAADFVFRLASPTLSDASDVLTSLLDSLTLRYPQVAEIYKIFGEETLRFLSLFGGTSFTVPKTEGDVQYTFLPEISSAFGEDLQQTFWKTFAGRALKLPPEDIVLGSIRASDIYRRMRSKDNKCVKELAAHYSISTEEVWWTYRGMEDLLGGRSSGTTHQGGIKEVLGEEEEDLSPEEFEHQIQLACQEAEAHGS